MANLNFGIFYYQHIVSVKDMLPKVWLFSISCILILINNSFLSASIISVNNIQYPDALHSPFNHHKETQAEEMDGFVGRIFEYKIPESLFPCEVESYVASKKDDRFLPKWLWFDEQKRNLVGIPSEKDEGISVVLVVGLGRLINNPTGYICGSMTLKLTIWGLKHFPLFAENSLFRMKTFPGNHGLLGYSCAVNQPIILASLVLSVKFDDLTGKKRADVVVALSTVFGIAIRDVFVLPNAVQSPFLSLLESSHVVASGPGSRTLMTGPSTLLTWRVKCGVVHVKDPLFEELQQGSRKWSATKNISFEVIGWHVVTGFQRRYNMQVLLRRRRNALGGSTTPVYSTIPISRATVVTTRLRPSKTSYTTSTVFLTRVQPSPTFSSFFGNSSSFEIRLSSSRKLSEQTNSSLSQQSTVNLSSGILNSRNVSMIPRLSSFKVSSFIQASSTSTVIQRNTTVTVEPLNRVSISSDHQGSGELLSSTAFKNTTATISSYLRSRDTNYIRTSLLSFTGTSTMVSNSLYSSATLLPSLISSRSTSKIHNVTTASISVSSRSVKMPSPTRKYWLTSETKATTFSNPEQSRTSLVMSLDVISRTTNLASGTTGGISLQATTEHSVYESSIVSPTHPGITSAQSHVRTSSYPLLTAYRSSTFPIISTFRIVESSPHKTTLVNQTKTVVSSLSQFATPGLNVTPTTSLLTVSFVVSKTGPATSQLASYTSNFIFKSSVAYSTALKSSTVTDIQSLPIGFSSQTNVRDKTSFDIMLRTTLSTTSRKTSQFLTRITLSSVWFMGTTEATRFTPLQTSFSDVTQIKEYSSVMLTRMITGVTSSANLSATTVMAPGSKSVLDVVTPGLTRLLFTTGMTTLTARSFKPTVENSQAVVSNATWKILLTSTLKSYSISPSLTINFSPTLLTLPTEQLNTFSLSYFIKEPSSTPLVTPPYGNTSIQTKSGFSSIPTPRLPSRSALGSSSSILPSTPSNSSPKLYNSFDLLIVRVGKVFSVQIPIDTFHDREDGNTRNLVLNCLDRNLKPLSRSSWLQFNSTTQTLYGLALDSQVKQIKVSSEYFLVARDRDGNKAYDAFSIDLRENDETLAVMFTVRITKTSLKIFDQDLSNVLLLVKNIASYYGDEDESMVRVISVNRGSVLFTWSNVTVQTCNKDLISQLALKVIAREGYIHPAFQNALLPAFVAEDIYENRTGPCIFPNTTDVTLIARVSSLDRSLWLKYFLPGVVIGILIIVIAVTCFIVRRHTGVKVLDADKQIFKKRKPIILDEELELSTFSGKPIELPDDSLTPIRFPKETSLTNPDDDNESCSQRPSPTPSAPLYQGLPPRYESVYNNRGYSTPPPAYKLPPSY